MTEKPNCKFCGSENLVSWYDGAVPECFDCEHKQNEEKPLVITVKNMHSGITTIFFVEEENKDEVIEIFELMDDDYPTDFDDGFWEGVNDLTTCYGEINSHTQIKGSYVWHNKKLTSDNEFIGKFNIHYKIIGAYNSYSM